MITRFTTFTVRPLIAAQNRRLQRNETVQDYYKDKVRLLRKVGLSDIDIASQLTQGMPEHYQNILIGSRVNNPNEWLEIATTLEANRNRPAPDRTQVTNYSKGRNEDNKEHKDNKFSKNTSKKPWKPCKFCEPFGEKLYHWHSECPRRTQSDSKRDVEPKPPEVNNMSIEKRKILNTCASPHTTASDQFVKIKGHIFRHKIMAMIDTGSTTNIMAIEIAQRMKLKINRYRSCEVEMANGSTKTCGSVSFPLTINSITRCIDAQVLKDFNNCLLLGVNIGAYFPLTIDLSNRRAIIREIKGKQTTLFTEHKVYFNQNSDLKSDTNQEMKQIETILEKYSKVFSKSESDMGLIRVEKHRIILTDDIPVAQRYRPQSLANNQEIEKQCQIPLEKNLIRKSTSPYACNVTLVPKKDGSKRMCINYIPINKKTVTDKQPMPLVSEVIDSVRNAKYFSTVDMKNGYWHIEMDPNDIPKTAFMTKDNLYEWLVMPFGLKNAAATFQRVMRTIFKDLLNKGVISYIDDLLIYSDTYESHQNLIEEVFKRLEKHNIKLRKDKCQFFTKEIEYLGHILGHNTVKPSEKKIKSIKDFPEPETLKELQRALGLAGYLRKFVPKFSTMAEPLTRLTRKYT
jgi:hypothetical protein